MNDREAQGQTLVRRTAGELKRSILSGAYAPGDRLPSVEDLAAKFSVSRTVIREAIRVLAAKGLVRVRHGDGTFVREPCVSDLSESLSTLVHFEAGDNRTLLVDLTELRIVLESAAANLAASRAMPQDWAAISRALESGKAAVVRGDRDAIVESDVEFHAAIARASHNVLLPLLLDVISPLLRDLRLVMMGMPTMAQLTIKDHERLLEAIVGKQPKIAEDEARRHVELLRALLYQHLFGVEATSTAVDASTVQSDS